MQRVVLTILAVSALCFAADPVDKVLAKGKLSRTDVRFDRQLMDFYGGGPYRLKIYDLMVDRPLEIPYYNHLFVHQLFEGSPSIARGMFFASMRTDESVRRGLISHPVSIFKEELKDGNPKIITALDRLNEVAGKKNVVYDFRLPQMPQELEEALAVLLLASAQAVEYRDLAFRHLSQDEQARLRDKALAYITDDASLSIEDSYFVEECIGRVEYSIMYAGLEDLALVLDSIIPLIDSFKESLPELEFPTPFGEVKIAGKGDDTYDSGYLLLIEPGGDDLYSSAGSNAGADMPLSVVIDLVGDDRYLSDKTEPSLAAGVTGAGFLVDWAGNDFYSSASPGEGAGLFGAGVLYDREGADHYEGFSHCQASGTFGAGILVDVSGDDVYHAFHACQGYGFTKGCGLLLDLAGNDCYVARNDSLVFPSPQSGDYNASMAQGFGFGKRADFTDGHSLAGGIGVLADAAGNDSYDAGVFAQGCGYWYGVGLLTDNQGDDSYAGPWYVQGSGAHFALGVLDDVSGADTFTATINMAQGAGHDYSIGYLLDEAGNDTYNAPNLSLGGGNANGIGIFQDMAGDDVYNVTAATTLGLANIGSRGGIRDGCICLGLFMDTGGGSDKYPDGKKAANNKCWFNPGADTINPISTEIGIGIDE